MTLVRIMGQSWHAVERDLLALGYRREDIGTPKLTLWELISIVVAAPPGTAVHHAQTRQGSLSQEAQLLADLGEQYAGLINLRSRYARPGSDSSFRPPMQGTIAALPDYSGVSLDAYPAEEFKQRLAEMQRERREKAEARVVES